MGTILAKMCRLFIDDGVIDEDVYATILNRETMSVTDMKSGIVLPHALSKQADSKFIVAHLNKPMQWKNYQVRLVAFMLIADKDMPVFNQLFKLLADCDKLKVKAASLIHAKNYEQFITILNN